MPFSGFLLFPLPLCLRPFLSLCPTDLCFIFFPYPLFLCHFYSFISDEYENAFGMDAYNSFPLYSVIITIKNMFIDNEVYLYIGWVGVMVDRGYFGQLGVILDKYRKIINNDA